MIPKPEPRIKDTALLEVLKFEYDECEISGSTDNLDLHHVVFKSQGGDDVRGNIVCWTHTGHMAYHGGDPLMKRALAQHILDSRRDVLAYLTRKLTLGGAGEWFRRHLEAA